jgi:hypothetical protein
MASNQGINWNIVLIGGLALGGLYYWNKIQSTGSGLVKTATDYTSGTTGETISTATQPTIRTDLRQSARTQRASGRQEVSINRQDEKTARVAERQETNQNRQDERTARTQIRQDAKTTRQENRIEARQERKVVNTQKVSNIKNIVNKVVSNSGNTLRKILTKRK